MARRVVADALISSSPYLVHRTIETELLPCLRNLGLTFYAYSPLAGGLLSGNYARLDDPLPKTSRFNAKDWFQKYFNAQTFQGLNQVRAACQENGISMGEAALRWMVHHSALGKGDGVILGGSSLQQFKDNMDWCGKGKLSQDIVDAFDVAYRLGSFLRRLICGDRELEKAV